MVPPSRRSGHNTKINIAGGPARGGSFSLISFARASKRRMQYAIFRLLVLHRANCTVREQSALYHYLLDSVDW